MDHVLNGWSQINIKDTVIIFTQLCLSVYSQGSKTKGLAEIHWMMRLSVLKEIRIQLASRKYHFHFQE